MGFELTAALPASLLSLLAPAGGGSITGGHVAGPQSVTAHQSRAVGHVCLMLLLAEAS